MSLFQSSVRPSQPMTDELVERYLVALRAELEPDPLFRRRLRGRVVNQFVAAREGIDARPRGARRQMGRLGRACLYASFALALSVGSVMAVSRESVPGDALYGLKRHIEELRMAVVPAHLHDDLVAFNIAERIDEMSRLVEAGDLERAAVLAESVQEGYASLAAIAADADAGVAEGIENRLLVLAGLVDQLPAAVRSEIDLPAQGPGGPGTPPEPGPPAAGGDSGAGDPTTNNGGENNDGANPVRSDDPRNPNGATNNGGANNDGSNPSRPDTGQGSSSGPGTDTGSGDAADAAGEGEYKGSSGPPAKAPGPSPRPSKPPKPPKDD